MLNILYLYIQITPPPPGPPPPPGFPIDNEIGIIIMVILGILYGCYAKWCMISKKRMP